MTTSKLVCLLCFFLCIHFRSVAQSPAIDPNWIKDTARSDEFTKTSGTGSQNGLFTSKWQVMHYPTYNDIGGATACNTNYAYDSTISSNGYLMLKVDSTLNKNSYLISGSDTGWTCDAACTTTGLVGNCNFNTGAIGSVSEFSYGYFEIYAKLPGYTSVTGDTGYAAKFWPAFWMADVSTGTHYEIDMMDQCCCDYSDAKTTGSGWECGSTFGQCIDWTGNCVYLSPTPLCSGFHKYAVEWNTDRIIFYRDDVPWYASYPNPTLTWHPMALFIALQLSCSCVFNQNTFHYNVNHKRSQFMQVDYFHYDTLNKACTTNTTLTTNSGVTSFVYAVYDNITFSPSSSIILGPGDGLSYATPPSGKQFIFRAVNEITINGDFHVPVGNTLVLEPTPCH